MAYKKVVSKPTFDEEYHFWETGYDFVIGIDEVGRGAFAGPLVVGAVAFDKNCTDDKLLKKINDSKLLTPSIRSELSEIIYQKCIFASIGIASVSIINKVGIGKATTIAIRDALGKINSKIDGRRKFILIDGFHIKYLQGIGLKNQKAIIKGDRKSISIAAASIVAKVYRDNLMVELSKKHPTYGLDKHKGYGTKEHQIAIRTHGLSKIHRTSFNIIASA